MACQHKRTWPVTLTAGQQQTQKQHHERPKPVCHHRHTTLTLCTNLFSTSLLTKPTNMDTCTEDMSGMTTGCSTVLSPSLHLLSHLRTAISRSAQKNQAVYDHGKPYPHQHHPSQPLPGVHCQGRPLYGKQFCLATTSEELAQKQPPNLIRWGCPNTIFSTRLTSQRKCHAIAQKIGAAAAPSCARW